jgi:uridylate kinase
MDCVVISLGGSILVPGEGDAEYMKRLAQTLIRLSQRHDLVCVCGGGRIARYYIGVGRELGAERDVLDLMGIETTRLNARLLQLALGDAAAATIPLTAEDAARTVRSGKIVVMGGTTPGHTTDAVAAMVAERACAVRIVNATSVDGAYSTDPKIHPDAERFDELTFDELHDLVGRPNHEAGPSDVFDPTGAAIVLRTKIPLYIVNGRNLAELEKAVEGAKFKGTVVHG